MTSSRTSFKSKSTRHGFILVATLGIMAVVISLLLPLVPASLLRRRQTGNELLRLQANYVMRAATERSLVHHQADSLQDETIEFDLATPEDRGGAQPPSSQLQTSLPAKIEISKSGVSLHIRVQLNASNRHGEDIPVSGAENQRLQRPQITIQKSWQLNSLQPNPPPPSLPTLAEGSTS